MRSERARPHLSVVIPCYNEANNLKRGVLDEVYQYLSGQDYGWEVIIVNDESTDDSRSLVDDFIAGKVNFSVLDIPHGGKPAAVWAGIQRAEGGIVLFTDMDQSTPLVELDKLLPWYGKGYDVVIGSRGTSREGFSIIRRLGSVVFRALRRLFLLGTISDTQCGFKSCRREAALEVFPRLQFFRQKDRPVGWKVSAYDVELLHLFEKAGYAVREVEVEWQNRDESDTKNQTSELARYVKESAEMTKEVIRVKRNEIAGLYDEVQVQPARD
ncbi:MAG: glycosyltransferase [Anaerolineae bacterium]|jgi:glycosyltransferase involved in cell wall biosynthesis